MNTRENTGKENTGNWNSGNWNSGNGNSGDSNSGNGNSGDSNSGNWNSGNGNSGDSNSGNGNSGDSNSGNWNSGNGNSGDSNSGNGNSGDSNSGNWNSGNGNSGDSNSGNGNSGNFNTDEPKMRSFNKECDMTYTEFRERFGYKDLILPVNSWICKEDMTDEEKENVEGWETMGGYLKTLSYKEAWKIVWSKATQEQKDWYKSFPNFDAKIFEEITGINVEEETFKSGEIIEICKNGKKIKCKIC